MTLNPYLHVMRNITLFAVLVIIVFSGEPVFSQAWQDYTVSLKPLFGFAHGHAEEIVYADGIYKSPLLSLLTWEMKPVLYYGLSMEFARAEPLERLGFFAQFSLKSGIPGPGGLHENRDWMSFEHTGLTHYSIHGNNIRELSFLDLAAGLSIPLNRYFLMKTAINVSFKRLSFYGTDGHGTYARMENYPGTNISIPGQYFPIYDEPDTMSFTGTVISYTQQWLYAAPGIALVWFWHNFSAELSFLASPLIYCAGLDEHKTTNVQYRDYMWGGVMIEPGLRMALSANSRLELGLDISWQYISGTRGFSWNRQMLDRSTFIQDGEAGASLSIFCVGFGLRLGL